jgi:hypothetical protein
MKILTTEETGVNCVPWGTSDPKPQQQKRRSKDKNEIILHTDYLSNLNDSTLHFIVFTDTEGIFQYFTLPVELHLITEIILMECKAYAPLPL